MTRETILARYAGQLLRPMATALAAISARYSASPTSGPAPRNPALTRQKCDGGPLTTRLDVLLAKRAMRTCNRSPDAAARFVRVHTILSRGR
jgi:hypothetical protein